MSFAHLHLHTEYSLLDGACRIEKALDRAAYLGQTAMAITDHGAMYGVVDFYRAAKKRGIKPIIGCEVYVAERKMTDREYGEDSRPYHLVLLCKNNTGYQNLIKLVSEAYVHGFYSKPRIDLDLLREHSEGLIGLSACLAGAVPRYILRHGYIGGRKMALTYNEIFGQGNFFLELQNHGIKEQEIVNKEIVALSKDTGIPLVATNDCHYVEKSDSEMHRLLICIQTATTIEEGSSLEFASEEFYIKSEDEMRQLFPYAPEAIDNTMKIADMCNVEFTFGDTKLPAFTVPDGESNEEYFRRMCFEGLSERYENITDELTDRLNYELDTISKMGYTNYYLIVHDFVRYAKENDIPVGPGRGSGAGSLAAYCLGITDIDPIKYNLLFERFLNPERVSMPDFDIDFSDERRQEMIEYVVQKYGHDHVAQIITFGTMAAKMAIRDVGRAMALPYGVVNEVSKLVPTKLNITLDEALQISPELKQRYNSEPQIKQLIDMSKKLEGMPRNSSTHAAGVVITDKPVDCYVPLARNGESIVCQFVMTTLEELGLLKMDFLGLRNLSVIDRCKKLVQRHTPEFDLKDIKDGDKDVYDMLTRGETEGVFQFESGGMRNVIMQLGPTCMEDLIAVISLYRPGPMASIPRYIKNRHDPKGITYLHKLLEPILNVTYGCIVYQEQVMQIFRELAGYSLGRADVVRRAMSKKKAEVMEKEKQIFIYGLEENGEVKVDGCIRRGVDEKTAIAIFNEMESFASYAFNKSHAAAYAAVSYQTAWLKCHYPKEYMAALLTSVLDSTNKMVNYIEDCERMNIHVLPPDVNKSDSIFQPEGDNIRFGLLAVKSVGHSLIDKLVSNRKSGGEFADYYDFCKRLYGHDLNRKALESLIQSGSLDSLSPKKNRRRMMMSIEPMLSAIEADQKKNLDGQLGLFDFGESIMEERSLIIPNYDDFTKADKLAMEKEVTGIYISGHPMDEFRLYYSEKEITKIADILDPDIDNDGRYVTALAVITKVTKRTTRADNLIAILNIEDLSGAVEVLCFPKVLVDFGEMFKEGNGVIIRGKISKDERETKILADSFIPASKDTVKSLKDKTREPVRIKKTVGKRAGLYLRFKNDSCYEYKKAMQYTGIFDGSTDMYLYFTDSKKLLKAPASMNVDVNEPLLRELKKLLGDENVSIVESANSK